jgi:large subunit ribosomal protein L22
MTGPKLNERDGTRATLTNSGYSASKARVVLNLIRNKPVTQARDILQLCERNTAEPILKLVNSAVQNAEINNGANGEELQVVACYADEARVLERSRPRARGRATPITKRSSHITVIVARMEDDELERLRKKQAENLELRRRRVQASRRRATTDETAETEEEETGSDPAELDETEVAEVAEVAGSEPVTEEEPKAKKTTAKKTAAKKTTTKKTAAKKTTAKKTTAKKTTAKKKTEEKPKDEEGGE